MFFLEVRRGGPRTYKSFFENKVSLIGEYHTLLTYFFYGSTDSILGAGPRSI